MRTFTVATRFILVVLAGLVLAACACGWSVPPAQPPAPTRASAPKQHTPQYSDFLGKNQYDPEFLNMSQRYCKLGQYAWICPGLGIEFLNSRGDNIVDLVWLDPPGTANIKGYEGELPYGLTWSDTRADVENKIGLPDRQYNFSWEYTKLGIGISYNTDPLSKPDPSAAIEQIKIFLR